MNRGDVGLLAAFGVMGTWTLVVLGLGLTMVVGYIMNVIDLLGMDGILESAEGIIRLIGLVPFAAPLGAFMGIFY